MSDGFTGTFTVMSRSLNSNEGGWTKGPVECNDLTTAMATQLSFLVGTDVSSAMVLLKEEDMEKVRNNLISGGRNRISNDEEEVWIFYRP